MTANLPNGPLYEEATVRGVEANGEEFIACWIDPSNAAMDGLGCIWVGCSTARLELRVPDSSRRVTAGVLVAVGMLFLFYLAAGEAIPVLPWAGLILVAVFVGVSAWTIRRVQSRVPDLREQRGEWGRWLLILFILEELAAGILMVAVALAMLFALFFESGLSSRDFDRTPFLMIIGGFLVLSMSILVWAVRQWALRSWTCFAVPLLVPVAALISSSLWNSLM